MNYKSADIGLLIFRIITGLSLAFAHGYNKLQKLIDGGEIKFMNFLGLGSEVSLFLAMSAEFFFALLVTLGLFTRLSTIPIIITMGIAAFIAHADDPFASKEKAVLFLASYLLLFFTGPGRFSIQNLFSKKLANIKGIKRFILE
ncbi:MAG: DoxX family protein [Bacteroidetes bacterium]|nr:DoxX family protein [Bacteroidota bacterium]